MNTPFYVVSFVNTVWAVATQKTLCEVTKLELPFMPTPRMITKSCGLSVRFTEEQFEAVIAAVDGLPDKSGIKGCYFIDTDAMKSREVMIRPL